MNYFSRSKIFLYALVSFVMGIFISPYVGNFINGLPAIVILLNCYIAVLLLIIFRRKKSIFCLIVLLFSCFLGTWRFQGYLPEINQNHIAFYNDNREEYIIEGTVRTEPEESGSNLQLQISNVRLTKEVYQGSTLGNSPRLNLGLAGKILVTLPKYYEVKYGDIVQFKTKLASPKNFDSFDYKSYLARYGVYSVANNVDDFFVITNYANLDELSRIEKAEFFVISTLYKIKNYFSATIEKIYPEPSASFMLGLLLGAKKDLPDWLKDIFQIIGITHIIAISGYNITILAKFAEKMLGRIGRKFVFWGVLALILFFVIMTGAQSSIVRAGIMGALFVSAGIFGRRGNAINALVFAGAVMIFLNPLILRYDIGFQLSFLATVGLIYLTPIFEIWFKKIPGFFREMLSATLAAQIFTIPIIIASFGKISLISPVANVIVLGFVPVAMFVGFLSGFAGILFLPLGQIIGFLGYIILEIIIQISKILSQIPYASLNWEMKKWSIWVVYYIAVSVLIFFFWRKNPKKMIK